MAGTQIVCKQAARKPLSEHHQLCGLLQFRREKVVFQRQNKSCFSQDFTMYMNHTLKVCASYIFYARMLQDKWKRLFQNQLKMGQFLNIKNT